MSLRPCPGWKHPGCHLFNIGKVRYVYALSVKAEAEVRRLLKEKKGAKTEDAMSKFSEYLNEKTFPTSYHHQK